MKNSSSKDQMNKRLDILKSIKKVKAPNDIYAMVNHRLAKHKSISLNMIRAIAAIFVLVVGFEVYMGLEYLTAKTSEIQSEVAYQLTDNYLYP